MLKPSPKPRMSLRYGDPVEFGVGPEGVADGANEGQAVGPERRVVNHDEHFIEERVERRRHLQDGAEPVGVLAFGHPPDGGLPVQKGLVERTLLLLLECAGVERREIFFVFDDVVRAFGGAKQRQIGRASCRERG